MSRATDLPSPHPRPRPAPPDLRDKHVCPFCGTVSAPGESDVAGHAGPCPRCSMADTPATRKATKARIGPWFVRQTRNPAAPGMRFDTLLALVKRGQVTAQSVVRGPTTYQLWRFAAQVKGLSRAFGVCYSCGGSVEVDATLCPHCNRMQEPPANPDVLLEGTMGQASAGATEPVRKEIRPLDPRPVAPPPPAAVAPAPRQPQQPADIFDAPVRPLDDLDAAFDRRADEAQPRKEHPLDRRSTRSEPPAAAPPRQRATANHDNAILSARDLAAAFQLDFNPKSMRRRRKWFKKLVAALILLALAGGVVYLIVNEDARTATFAWTQQQYAAVREAIVSRVQATPIEDKAAPVASGDRPSDIAPRDPSRDVRPAPTTNAMIAAATMPAAPPEVAAVAPPPPPKIELPRTPPPAPAPAVEPAPAPVDPAVAADQARTLWREAIDLEARRDFAGAVDKYEQIKKLPKNVWPGGLEINLELARKRLQ